MPLTPRTTAHGSALTRGVTAILSTRYALILLAVGLLLVIDQAVVQPRLVRLSVYGPTINIAGRQRMLSQKLVKEALAIQAADDPSMRAQRQAELRQTLELWRNSHADLLNGNEANGLPASTSPEIRQVFVELEPHFAAMSAAAAEFGRSSDGKGLTGDLLDHEQAYLPKMDRIVGMYEAEARSQATALRVLGISAAATVIVLLVALGRFVLQPATQTIRHQMEELEDRVAERTAELTAANESLQHEIHVRELAEERTRELSEQLAHTARVETFGQLATGLAHEVNQPLASIANYAEMSAVLLAQDPPDVDQVRTAITNIGQAAYRAGDIVRSMRNFLRPGQSPLCDVQLSDLIHEVINLCRTELQREQVTLKVEVADKLPELRVVPIQVQQVLLNLVQNGLHAMEDTAPEQRILRLVAHLHDSDFVQVEVIDSGPGFDRDPAKLFEPFVTTKETGLGIGLAIVRSLVQEHGGRVWAENRSRGAAVCFTLPVVPHHATRAAADSHCVCG